MKLVPTTRIVRLTRKHQEMIKKTKRNMQDKVEEVLYGVNTGLGNTVSMVHEVENRLSDGAQRINDTVNNALDGMDTTAKLVRYFSKEQLPKKGDHLKVERLVYTHHGIYIGEGKVIHYLAKRVQVDAIETFAKGQKVIILSELESPVNYSRDEIVKRAYSRLNENKYDLIVNNCEHFARWCRCGDSLK